MAKTMTNGNQKALIVKKVAEKHRLTPAYVYMVYNGDRNNDEVLEDLIGYNEALNMLFENRLCPSTYEIISFKN
jgi:hypothetical protein